MSSSSPFDIFDSPFKMQHIQRTPGSVNQTTGAFTLPVETTITIYGHFDPNPERTDGIMAAGNEDHGDARLWTEANIQVGDRVKIYLDAATFQTYVVRSVKHSHPILTKFGVPSTARRVYVLDKEAGAL